jgi:acyl-CoA synthetase (NDP forming)
MLQPVVLQTALGILASEPSVALAAFVMDAPGEHDKDGFRANALSSIVAGTAPSGKPAVVISNTLAPLSDNASQLLGRLGLTYFSGGIDRGVCALKHVMDWHRRGPAPAGTSTTSALVRAASRPVTEREVLAYLSDFEVPSVPAVVCTTGDACARAARHFGGSLALKIVAGNLSHKSNVGGVMLNVAAVDAAAAYDSLLARVRAREPALSIQGVLVSPMRTEGVELVVGIVRDRQWGLVLTVGLGGVLVEALQDVCVRVLPVTASDVLEMLARLKATALLDGYRGVPAVNRVAVAAVVCRIARAAQALGDDLVALEVNPLLVCEDRAECLDGLVEWHVAHEGAPL